MSADAKVTLVWFDGEDDFRLGIGEIRALQEKTGAGPETLRRRIVDGNWFIDDLRETIRLGLIGAGCKPSEAMEKVKRSFDARPFGESRVIAATIILAAVVGVPDDPVGKPSAEEAATGATDALPSPLSTEPEQH
ncbi:MAG: gene transfer agent family protein [Albidovulum sp.]